MSPSSEPKSAGEATDLKGDHGVRGAPSLGRKSDAEDAEDCEGVDAREGEPPGDDVVDVLVVVGIVAVAGEAIVGDAGRSIISKAPS